jgi:hypothetical protein
LEQWNARAFHTLVFGAQRQNAPKIGG